MRHFFKIILNKDSIEHIQSIFGISSEDIIETNKYCKKCVKKYVKYLNRNNKLFGGKIQINDQIIGFDWKLDLVDEDNFIVEIKTPYKCSADSIKSYLKDLSFSLLCSGFESGRPLVYRRYDSYYVKDSFHTGFEWKLEYFNPLDLLFYNKLYQKT